MSTLVALFDDEETLDEALDALYGEGFGDEVNVLREVEPRGNVPVAPASGSIGQGQVGGAVPNPATVAPALGARDEAMSALGAGFGDLTREEQTYYAEAVRDGGTLLSVRGPETRLEEARALLERHASKLELHG